LPKALIEWTIRRVRADDTYTLDPDLRGADIISEVFSRVVSLARGLVVLAGIPGGRMRFVESGCSFRHRRNLRIGSGSVIEHGARITALSREGIDIGRRVTIGKYSMIECTGVLWRLGVGLTIGDGSSVGDYSFIGCVGGVSIGKDVLMGQYVSFHSQNHRFDDPDRLIREQGVSEEGIHVGDDCWLGAGAKILDGVRLGNGCVVAAGAVVNRSFPPNTVIGGVPARPLGVRGQRESDSDHASSGAA
jgi:acetyltransferase-like isoleucine patch superfamily enzyme